MKVLATFPVWVDFHLDGNDLKEAIKKLTFFYTGDTECNVFDGKEYKSKYPEIEKSKPEYVQSHWNINRGYRAKIEVNLMEDGSLKIKK